MRYELKRVAIWPFIKISFFINLLIGFVFGLFYSPIVSVIMMMLTATPYLSSPNVESAPASWGALLFVIPFISAFLAGCVNTLIGLILVLAYNMFAILLGGLEFEFETVRFDSPPPPPVTRPSETPTNPTYYAAAGGTIPPPPPPPPVRPSAPSPAPRPETDPLDDTDRMTRAMTPLTSEPRKDMLSESGRTVDPFTPEPGRERPEDPDAEGKRSQ